MDKKVDLNQYNRREIYKRFLHQTNNSVCVSGEFDITRIYKYHKKGYKLNCLMLFCVQQASDKIKEFHYSIKNDELYYCDEVYTTAVVKGKDDLLYFVSYPFNQDYLSFEKQYIKLNKNSYNNCEHHNLDEGAMISTSTVLGFPFTSISLGIPSDFNSPFLMWGQYKKKAFKVKLNISFRFHHSLFDGEQVAKFFTNLQKEFNNFKI